MGKSDIRLVVPTVKYFYNIKDRFRWEKIPGLDWWLVSFEGFVFAEVFRLNLAPGNTLTRWHGLLYTVLRYNDGSEVATGKWFTDASLDDVRMTVCGCYINRRS